MEFLEGSLHNIVIGDKKPMQQLRYYLFTHQNAIMYLVILFTNIKRGGVNYE